MLTSKFRLPTSRIPVISRSNHRSSNLASEVRFSANNLAYPRFSISVAKKNIHLATDRNRVKRVARAAIISWLKDPANQTKSFDVLLLLYKKELTHLQVDELLSKIS